MEKLKILLIEDDHEDVFVFNKHLKKASEFNKNVNYETDIASSLEEAKKFIKLNKHDIILADLTLPDSQGIGTFEQLQAIASGCPIIILTGFSDEELAFSAIHRGAADYLMKGQVSPQTLLRSIRYSIERRNFDKLTQLQATTQKYSQFILAILASIPDAVFIVQENGTIIFSNPPANYLYEKTGLLEQVWPKILTHLESCLVEKTAFVALDFNDIYTLKIEDNDRHFVLRIAPLTQGKELPELGIIILQDVTELRFSDLAKTDLIGTVSHELKTPLTTLQMYLMLLEEEKTGTLNEPQREMIGISIKETLRLNSIINNLLELSRYQESITLKEPVILDLHSFINQSIEELVTASNLKGIRITKKFSDQIPFVKVVPAMFNLALNNVIANAIKYSPENSEICIQTFAEGDNQVKIYCSDEGPGISAENATKVFDKFFRASGVNKPGTGLGLSIARQMVAYHKGRIFVDFTTGCKGTVFVITIPIDFEKKISKPA